MNEPIATLRGEVIGLRWKPGPVQLAFNPHARSLGSYVAEVDVFIGDTMETLELPVTSDVMYRLAQPVDVTDHGHAHIRRNVVITVTEYQEDPR